MVESEEELKSLLMKVKEESKKVGLKLNIQKTKIMASSPITSWEIDGEIVETVLDFIFWGSKITADGDCSNEIKLEKSQFWKQEILLKFWYPNCKPPLFGLIFETINFHRILGLNTSNDSI